MNTHVPAPFRVLAREFQALVHGGCMTVYRLSADGRELVSWYRSSDREGVKRRPVDCQSLAGYAAHRRALVRIDDVYDANLVSAHYPDLLWDGTDDDEPGLAAQSVMAAPVRDGDTVLGVVELLNCTNLKTHGRFTDDEVKALKEFALHLAGILADDRYDESVSADDPYDGLARRGIVSRATLAQYRIVSRKTHVSVGHLLATQAGVPMKEIGNCLEAHYQRPFVEYVPGMETDASLLDALNRDYLERRRWVPVGKSGNGAIVLIDDPGDHTRVEEIKTVLNVQDLDLRVALPEDMVRFLYPTPEGLPGALAVRREVRVEELVGGLAGETPAQTLRRLAPTELGDEDAAPVVQIVSKLIADAIQQNASDIHIEPSRAGAPGLVRYRVDGVCHDVLEVPGSYMPAMVSRIKIMARMDITETRVPLDGKMAVRMDERLYELRVATVPTVNGESAVLRILPSGSALRLDDLNLSPRNRTTLEELIDRPHGIFLVVGPTGSGKTTTLHGILAHLNGPDQKIWTAEDPVEITQPRLQQVQINPKVNLTFATALRSFLRADPDVILIGEMRDYETAHAGIEASLTGHLVFSTLHTNSAAETVTRLLDLGLDPINFADALVGVLAQRLVRTLCPACRAPYTPDKDELEFLQHGYGSGYFAELNLDPARLCLYRAVGCPACLNRGYKGRTGIHELLVASRPLRALITQRRPAAEIHSLAVAEGMRTLRQDGIQKILRGETDADQVWSATVET